MPEDKDNKESQIPDIDDTPPDEPKGDSIEVNEEPVDQDSPSQDSPAEDSMDIPKEVSHAQIPSAPVEKASKSTIIKRLLIALLVLIILAAGGFAAWKFLINKDDSTTAQQEQAASGEEQSSDELSAIDLALGNTSLSETYTSDFLRLEFDHPESWEVNEDGSFVIVKSPSFDIQDNSGETVESYFKIYIKRSTGAVDAKYLGKGYAIAPSEDISYDDPAAGQREDTYLTNFGLDEPDNFAYFVVQGSFKLKKGETLGPDFAKEPEAFLVSGGYATEKQKDGLETITLSTDDFDNLAYQTGVNIVKSLQLK